MPRTNCRSESVAVTPGAVHTDGARAALGAAARVDARPFALGEAIAAARVVARESAYPRCVVVVGIVLDMMPGHLTPRRALLARRLRIRPQLVVASELVWEVADDADRMRLLAAAVRVARVRRLGAACRG